MFTGGSKINEFVLTKLMKDHESVLTARRNTDDKDDADNVDRMQ